MAAARNPAKSNGLKTLADKHGSALTFVTLDVADPASIKVCPYKHLVYALAQTVCKSKHMGQLHGKDDLIHLIHTVHSAGCCCISEQGFS